VLESYIRMMNDTLSGFLEGLYLHGSLALDAFEPRLSDIDFIAVTSRRSTPNDLAHLRMIHETLRRSYPRFPLEGSYLCWSDLGQLEDTIPPHPHIHDGVLHQSGYHDINGVTWCILKHRGIAVMGPPPEQLDIHIDWDDLVRKMRHNLHTYWASFTTHPQRMVWLLGDYGIQWTVLGVLRQLYTFREHDITSKTGAGVYGLEHLPQRWHPLIREALAIRAGEHTTLYRSRFIRAIEAHGFLCVIIAAYRSRLS
jgi:hypothetical protein